MKVEKEVTGFVYVYEMANKESELLA